MKNRAEYWLCRRSLLWAGQRVVSMCWEGAEGLPVGGTTLCGSLNPREASACWSCVERGVPGTSMMSAGS